MEHTSSTEMETSLGKIRGIMGAELKVGSNPLEVSFVGQVDEEGRVSKSRGISE